MCKTRTFIFNGEKIDVKKMYRRELDEKLGEVIKKINEIGDEDDDLMELCKSLTAEINFRIQNKSLTNNFLVGIIDNLEDWLDKKGVRIPNEERDNDDPDNCANFYGDDFDWMMEMLREECREHGIIVEDKWDD